MHIRECNDKGNAERFTERHGNNARFVPEIGKNGTWFIHKDNGWKRGSYQDLAWPIIPLIAKEAEGAEEVARKQELLSWCKSTGNNSTQTNMLIQAQGNHRTSLELFDNNPEYINCKNGILDCRALTLVPHSSEHLHMKFADANYIEGLSPCHKWTAFLNDIYDGDTETIDYLQVFFGYGSMGFSTEHLLHMFFGTGRNGKGVLLDTIADVLGDYSRKGFDFDAFLKDEKKGTKSARDKEAIYRLDGMRLVVCSEVNIGRKLDEALLKKVTGGEWLSGAPLFHPEYEFPPTHTIALRCNTLPEYLDKTIAMEERLVIVPHTKVYSKYNQSTDTNIKETFSHDGVMSWLAIGANKYLHNKGLLPMSEAIKDATSSFLDRNNSFRKFVREHIEMDYKSNYLCHTLHDTKYSEWCKANNEPILEDKAFVKALLDSGIRCERKSGRQTMIGFRPKG